jgi:hypothetical protein
MFSGGMIVDAWMQHPSRSFVEHPMFDSLKRWSRGEFGSDTDQITIDRTIEAMDEAVVPTKNYVRQYW